MAATTRGPLPKRTEERRRRNKSGETQRVTMRAMVQAPGLPVDTHPIAEQWYNALKKSGQSQWYEPSDWAAALYVCDAITKTAKNKRFSSMSFAAIWSAMGDLLTTEGDRRRARIEVERTTKKTEKDAGVTALNDYRKRLG